jgi:hypothetical protein
MLSRDRLAIAVLLSPVIWFAGYRWLHKSSMHLDFNGATLVAVHELWYPIALAVWTACVLVAAVLFARGARGRPRGTTQDS